MNTTPENNCQAIMASIKHLTPNKPVILAIHGWLDNAASFKPLIPMLSDYSVIAVDLVGHGYSQHRSEDANYHLMDWVQDLYQFILNENLKEVILLGHSLGGIIASIFASCFPEHVSKLILIESAGPLTEKAEKSVKQLRDSILSRDEMSRKQAKHPTDLETVIRARMLAGPLNRTAAEILVSRNLQEMDDSSLRWRSDPRLRTVSSLRLTEPQASDFISNISCPVQVILGDQGFEKMRKLMDLRSNCFSNMSVTTVAGSHHCHMDSPQQVAEIIYRFTK
jgi:pimeloyl-ACP methyl ester carboxylesterase